MASNSDFVLDEGLDDDEDVLAFHAQRQRTNTGSYNATDTTPDPSTPQQTSAPRSATPVVPPGCIAVILDGMPLTASRADLDAFLDGCGEITSLKLQHFESRGFMQARVQFATSDAACRAVGRSDAPFGQDGECSVTVRPVDSAGAEDKPTEMATKSPGAAVTAKNEVLKLAGSLPDAATVSSSFWSAFGAARNAAERLEERAKQLGQHLEEQLKVSDKVEETKTRLAAVDTEYHVSERVGEMAAAGRASAGEFDEKIGISKSVGAVAGSVGSAAKIIAREVDENLDISGKAREATNAAMRHESIGPAVKSVVDSIGGLGSPGTPSRMSTGAAAGAESFTPRRRKNYQPRGVEPEPLNVDGE